MRLRYRFYPNFKYRSVLSIYYFYYFCYYHNYLLLLLLISLITIYTSNVLLACATGIYAPTLTMYYSVFFILCNNVWTTRDTHVLSHNKKLLYSTLLYSLALAFIFSKPPRLRWYLSRHTHTYLYAHPIHSTFYHDVLFRRRYYCITTAYLPDDHFADNFGTYKHFKTSIQLIQLKNSISSNYIF